MSNERVPAKVGKSKRWVPKKWLPIYDTFVACHIVGWSNKRIGEQFGYSDQQVCNILKTPEAEALKKLAQEQIRKRIGEEIPNKLAALKSKAVERIETVLTSEELATKNPLAVADRALAFLKGVGELDKDDKDKGKGGNVTVFNIPVDLAQKLVGGMDKANEALMRFGNTEVRRLPSDTGGQDSTAGS